MTRDQAYAVATDPTFLKRVEVSLARMAVPIADSDRWQKVDSLPTPAQRAQVAQRILAAPVEMAALMSKAMVGRAIILSRAFGADAATTAAAVTDTEIDGAINQVWNSYI